MIPDLYKVIGVILALVALVGVTVSAYKMVDSRAYSRGASEERAKWQARESKELAASNAMILLLEDTNRMLERKAQIAVTNANDARRKADEAEKHKVVNVSGNVSNALASLCNAGTASGEGSSSGSTGATPADSERSARAGDAGLFGQIAASLASEANRADDYARKLIQAVELLKVDRETCNAL